MVRTSRLLDLRGTSARCVTVLATKRKHSLDRRDRMIFAKFNNTVN